MSEVSKNSKKFSKSKKSVILISSIFILGMISIHYYFCFDFEPYAQIATFVGLIVSILAAYLLYGTLVTQKETLEEIIKNSEIESFENKFFNLLKTQREIAAELKAYFNFLDSDLIEINRSIEGRDIFIYLISELTKIWKSISTNEYLGKRDEESLNNLQRELSGFSNPDNNDDSKPTDFKEERKKGMIENERLRFTNKVYNLTKDDWGSFKNKDDIKRIIFISNRFFNQYSYAIGHYYRHFFLILNFVDQFENEDAGKTKNYINFLEAQMSPFELALLFYYSASDAEILTLLKKYNFFEHLTNRDLIDPSHIELQF